MFTGKDIKKMRKKFYDSKSDAWNKKKSSKKKIEEFAKKIEYIKPKMKLTHFAVLNWERNPNKAVPKKWWERLEKLGSEFFKEDKNEQKVNNEFIDKIKQWALYLSGNLLTKAVSLYLYCQSSKVKPLEKVMIYSTLAYFIMPIDIIPDFMPLGFTDDLAMIVGTFNSVLGSAGKNYEKKAKKWLISIGIFVKD